MVAAKGTGRDATNSMVLRMSYPVAGSAPQCPGRCHTPYGLPHLLRQLIVQRYPFAAAQPLDRGNVCCGHPVTTNFVLSDRYANGELEDA